MTLTGHVLNLINVKLLYVEVVESPTMDSSERNPFNISLHQTVVLTRRLPLKTQFHQTTTLSTWAEKFHFGLLQFSIIFITRE